MARQITRSGELPTEQVFVSNKDHRTSSAEAPSRKMDPSTTTTTTTSSSASSTTSSLGPHRDTSPSDKAGRSSFSSVRENDSDLAQAFTSTKVSSYSKAAGPTGEHAVAVADDLPSPSLSPSLEKTTKMGTQTQFMPPVTNPDSRLHGCWFPAVAADSFQGWKQIGVKGRQASKSFGDLQALKIVWSVPPTPAKPVKRPGRAAPGQAPIERLPLELLGT
jgi:hypothetical protein